LTFQVGDLALQKDFNEIEKPRFLLRDLAGNVVFLMLFQASSILYFLDLCGNYHWMEKGERC